MRSSVFFEVQISCNSRILHLVDPFVLPVVAKRNVAFMIELNFAARFSDLAFPFHYTTRFPVFGWSPNAVSMLPLFKRLEVSIAELDQSTCEHNACLIDSVGPWVMRSSTLQRGRNSEKIDLNLVVGPASQFGDLCTPCCRTLWGFGVWAQHGGAAEKSCRVIDDGREGGQNASAGSLYCHRPLSCDKVTANTKTIQLKWPGAKLSQFFFDYKGIQANANLSCNSSLVGCMPVEPLEARERVFLLPRTHCSEGKELRYISCVHKIVRPYGGCSWASADRSLRG